MDGYQEVYEINLIDLMFYCMRKWRWIVVCMVFLAVTMGVYKYQETIAENRVKKEQQLKQSSVEAVEGEGGDENEPIVFEDPVSLAVTFAIIGMIGGICLTSLAFCMNYVMSGKLRDTSNFQQKFGMPLLGVVRKSETKKKLFGFIDRWIGRLEEGPCARIPRKEQIKIVAANVQSAIHRNHEEKIKRVMLVGSVAGDDVMEICEQLTEEIREVSFSPYRQIVFHAAALKKLEYYEGVLFIENRGESYERLIRQEKKLALDRDVKILGVIVC